MDNILSLEKAIRYATSVFFTETEIAGSGKEPLQERGNVSCVISFSRVIFYRKSNKHQKQALRFYFYKNILFIIKTKKRIKKRSLQGG